MVPSRQERSTCEASAVSSLVARRTYLPDGECRPRFGCFRALLAATRMNWGTCSRCVPTPRGASTMLSRGAFVLSGIRRLPRSCPEPFVRDAPVIRLMAARSSEKSVCPRPRGSFGFDRRLTACFPPDRTRDDPSSMGSIQSTSMLSSSTRFVGAVEWRSRRKSSLSCLIAAGDGGRSIPSSSSSSSSSEISMACCGFANDALLENTRCATPFCGAVLGGDAELSVCCCIEDGDPGGFWARRSTLSQDAGKTPFTRLLWGCICCWLTSASSCECECSVA